MKLSIVVPTYNERENLPILVKKIGEVLKGLDFELIIVDDDSPDETWKLAQEMKKEYPFIKVLRRVGERDLSTAVLDGFKQANGDVLAVMDADLQHPPEKLLNMYKKIEEGADIVIGSRYVEGGEIEEWSIIRRLYSKFATLLAHIFLPNTRIVRDPMSGFFMCRRGVIEKAELNPVGYKILLEVLAKGVYRRVEEEPITFMKRKKGKSSLNLAVQIKYLRHLLRLSWEKREIYRILKFALVGLSGVFVNLGILWMLTDIVGFYYLLSAVFSIEASIISNFVMNDVWTFRDRKKKGFGEWLKRMAKFNVVSLPSFPMQMVVMGVLKEFFGVYYLLAAFFGILIVFIWNFVANTLWTWRNI